MACFTNTISELRGLEEAPSSLSNESFVFDGSNSDIARQLYIRHQAGDSKDQVNLTTVPTAVADRLDPLNIAFGDLPGLVQRAVLWDSGFAISPGNDPVQIWTLYKHSMANLALPVSDVSAVDCTTINCSQPNNVTAYYTQYCSSSQILNMVRCVAGKFKDEGAGVFLGPFWSVGGNPNSMPELLLNEHTWTEATAQAPEILEGKRYDEKADIYSFGVVLSELDTCKIPFSDALTEDGSKAKPFQILQSVMSGTLLPRFSSDCPQSILQIALSCLKLDPTDRPTARQLVQHLESSGRE
ncbi:TKL/DRK protein kinase [Phytophthora cinnamomi]|uniref:TKL/DRK protein kinase n=1 Tax=Phytophthora cinnamomi TaxID=4785 RepID=UPI003559B488|nr:TKL/DRK protein kinase [Phytophthora cinnamomi]